MSRDIDHILRTWEYQSDTMQTRIVRVSHDREVIQLRIDLGLMQLETTGRPDGRRPEGFLTYFDYLRNLAEQAENQGVEFQLSATQCHEADREFMQFYHRRVCFLTMREYEKAVSDADHTLAFMDLVRDHSPTEEVRLAHEQYRPFVIFHKVQAQAALHSDRGHAEKAIDAVGEGLESLRQYFVSHDAEENEAQDPFVAQLRLIDQQLRSRHGIQTTLRERLDAAVQQEDYETAARLRDELRQRRESLRTDGRVVS